MRKIFYALTLSVFGGTALCGLFADTVPAMNGYLNWSDMNINVDVRLNLRSIGVSLPAGRSIAEERLFSEYYSAIKPFIHSIPVDSSSVLGDFVEHGELAPEMVDHLAFSATMIPPSISLDMRNITASYRITLNEVSSTLIRHNRGAEFYTMMGTEPQRSYTGIIIIAQDDLPVHGRKSKAKLTPCLFPKIWDTEMNLIFDKKFTDPQIFRYSTMVHYLGSTHIFQKTPSGLSPEIEKIVGDKPLRILARGVFGINPTDPVIDSKDAMIILSQEENRRLLQQGRIAVITADSVLKREL